MSTELHLDADGVPIVADSRPDHRPAKLSPADWAKQNLFDSITNSVITVVFGAIAVAVGLFGLTWVLDADFAIIRANLRLFMVGQFPKDELWRLWVSGYMILGAIGLVSGALAHNAHELATEQGVPADKESLVGLARRFWALIAVIVFFVSFARTALPYIGIAAAFVLVIASRELGWRMPGAIRRRAVFIGSVLAITSMLVLAGTSKLGGVTLGLVAFLWAVSEMGHRDAPTTTAGRLLKWAIPLAVAIAVYVIEVVIPFDGFGWEDWGGLHITLFTAVVGIALGMPFGILLALGRQSDLPVIKTASVLFIEFVRGVPLISLLLFSGLMLPFFLPIDFERPADLTLAMIVIMGFSAAYIAEIVRGGLQAVPKGQTEAAQALGLSPGSMQRLIVLPQALRAVIPAMVGQFIALFKDTSLLVVVGILEFLDVGSVANNQNEFLGKGLAGVTYVFVAIGYWAFAYTMSKESRRLETKLGVGTR